MPAAKKARNSRQNGSLESGLPRARLTQSAAKPQPREEGHSKPLKRDECREYNRLRISERPLGLPFLCLFVLFCGKCVFSAIFASAVGMMDRNLTQLANREEMVFTLNSITS